MAVEWVGLGVAVTKLLLRVTDHADASDAVGDTGDFWSKLRAFRRQSDPVTKAVTDTLGRQLTADLSIEDEQEVRAAAIQVVHLLNDLADSREAVAEAAAHPDQFLLYASRHGGNARRRDLGQRAEPAFDRILKVACDRFAQLVPSSATFLPAMFEELRGRVDELLGEMRRVSGAAEEAAQYSREAATKSQRAVDLLEAAERDVVKASRAATSQKMVLGSPVREWTAGNLRVHDTISVGEVVGLTPYILRPHDNKLRLALTDLTRPKMVTVVGTSCTGKTRTCVEAVRATLPEWALVSPLDVDELTRLLRSGIPARTVVWLDELQNFLTIPGGVEAARAVRRLLTEPGVPPMLFLGTVWPDNLTALEARPSADQATVGRGDISALLAETKGDRVQVPDAFTAAELQAVSDDLRIQTAIRHAVEGQVIQVLAGGTQLVDRAYGAAMPGAYSPTERAVILAAADLRRVGHPDPLPEWAIVGAAPGYLDPAQARYHRSSTWVQETLDDLMGEASAQHSGQSDLHRRGVPALRPAVEEGYVELHDYLLQHHLRVRRHHPTTETLWSTLTNTDNLVSLTEHATTLGYDAAFRGLRQEAAALAKVAADAEDRYGARALAARLARRRDADAATGYDFGDDEDDSHTRRRSVALRAGWGNAEVGAELRALADAGDEFARESLAEFLAPWSDAKAEAELRARADGGGVGGMFAQVMLLSVLVARGDAEAVGELRARADAGEWEAQRSFMPVLAARGDAEAVAELRMRADAGNRYAQDSLAGVLVRRRDAHAVAELRARADAGDRYAQDWLAKFLSRRGDTEAVAELRARADAGDMGAPESLAELLAGRGDAAALAELEAWGDAGDFSAQKSLVAVLARRRDADAVAQLRRCVHAVFEDAADELIVLYRSSGGGADLDLDVNANPRPPIEIIR